MNSLLIVTLLIAAPPADPTSQKSRTARFPTAEEFREGYVDIMTRSTRRAVPEPEAVIPRLLELYAYLDHVEDLSGPESRRMNSRLEIRLIEMHKRLGDRLKSLERRNRRSKTNTGGGAVAARATELMDLIQNTIAPESWLANGGQGTISFYSITPALVIRQTGEVQHQIGNTLDVLRK